MGKEEKYTDQFSPQPFLLKVRKNDLNHIGKNMFMVQNSLDFPLLNKESVMFFSTGPSSAKLDLSKIL